MCQLRHLIKGFLAHVKISVNAGTTSPKTLQWYGDMLQCLKPLHDRPANSLRASDLVDVKITNGRARVIKCMFAWAADEDLVKKDYFKKGLKVPRCGRRKRILTREELGQLMWTCSPRLRRLLFVMYMTIARPGEMRELTWGQILWQERCIVLREFKGKERRADQLEERQIGVPVRVMWVLLGMWRKSPDRSCTGHVFYSRNGNPWTKDALVRAISMARKRVGLDKGGEKICCYHLRHTSATNALNEGEDLKHISMQMGHASTKTTELYCHLSSKDIVEAIDRIAARPRTRKHRQKLLTSQAG